MSQRLYVGETDSKVYDCVISSPGGARERLVSEWMGASGGCHVGPWQVFIGNLPLFCLLCPVFEDVFASLGHVFPTDVYAFHYAGRSLEHPSRDDLLRWLTVIKVHRDGPIGGAPPITTASVPSKYTTSQDVVVKLGGPAS